MRHSVTTGSRRRAGLRILVVDDDEELRQTLVELLESIGMLVRGARDGAEAIEKLREEMPDLLLLDYRMPRLDGAGVVAVLQSEGILPTTILMTAARDARDLSLRLGVPFYLEKPFQLSTLELVVERALDHMSQRPPSQKRASSSCS